MNQVVTNSSGETAKVAEMILSKVEFKKINKPVVFMLRGGLGGGKTVFAKSIGKVVGVKETITSPTFIIFNEYKAGENEWGVNRFLHFDLYRIEDGSELDVIGFLNLFDKDSITCVEWPENMGENYLEKFRKTIYAIDVWFEYGEKECQRRISFDLGKQNFG